MAAFAEKIPSAPGWSLTHIEEEKEDGDYSIENGPVFFALKPPDKRPAITVDGRTAARLRDGQATAEGVYSQRSKQAGAKDKNPASVSKGGFVIPETVKSTLTTDDGRQDYEEVVTTKETITTSESSSLSGTGSGGSSFKPPVSGLPYYNPSGRNVSSSGSSSPGAGGQSAPPPGAAPLVDPRTAVIAEEKRLAEEKKAAAAAAGELSATNSAANKFDVHNKEYKQEAEEESKPAGGTKPPVVATAPGCRAAQQVYTRAEFVRITVPAGCKNIRVRAWGGGGGDGGLSNGNATNDEGSNFLRDGSDQVGSGHTGHAGSGGDFVSTSGPVDFSRYDLLIVVGGPGGHNQGSQGGLGGFMSGGRGGSMTGGYGGGGGGGFSGIFYVERSRPGATANLIVPENVIAVAAGGGGAGVSGGFEALSAAIQRRLDRAGINWLSSANAKKGAGANFYGGAGANGGGGGGGGWKGGTGDAGASDAGQLRTAGFTGGGPGGGGSSYVRFSTNSEVAPASGARPGNPDASDRGGAGDPGVTGKVVVDIF